MSFMNTMLTRMYVALTDLRARFAEERGQDLLEYALLGGLIAIGILAVTAVFTGALTSMINGIGSCIDFDSTTVCDPI